MTDGEWPKPWGDIFPIPDHDDGYRFRGIGPTYLDMGPLREFDGTLYINAEGGHETDENPDAWLPLGVYLEQGGADD